MDPYIALSDFTEFWNKKRESINLSKIELFIDLPSSRELNGVKWFFSKKDSTITFKFEKCDAFWAIEIMMLSVDDPGFKWGEIVLNDKVVASAKSSEESDLLVAKVLKQVEEKNTMIVTVCDALSFEYEISCFVFIEQKNLPINFILNKQIEQLLDKKNRF